MKRPLLHSNIIRYVLMGIVLLIILSTAFISWNGIRGEAITPGFTATYWVFTILLCAVMSFLLWNFLFSQSGQQKYKNIAAEELRERLAVNKRLDGMIQLNQLLIAAQSEKELVDQALKIIAGVVEAVGVSFVPYDEWGQPLRTYVYGTYPEPVLRAWSEHLASPSIRQRCQVCTQLQGDTENACPLLEAPFTDVIRIYCIPIKRNTRPVGIVNLYLRAEQEISADTHDYLALMLEEMALAIEVTRLRNQELVTLRQLQLVHSQPEDLSAIVGKLIDGLREVLDFKNSRAVFRPAEPRFPGFELVMGSDPWLSSDEASAILQEAIGHFGTNKLTFFLEPHIDGTKRLVLPFCLPEGTSIGAVIMTGSRLDALLPRQAALIETVTTQAALLVENERRRLESEYRTIIQERVRLAREIHDSLAQTLAYLKLTSSQMQSQLAQGDLIRLAQNLQHSHDTLADAYLETRQAIDNLRFAPQQDMVSWLKQVTYNFEQSSNLKVDLSVPPKLPQLSPEVQAQLLRIIQEALSNVRKHAQARKVWITVREWNKGLVFDLGDDGIGFTADDVPDLSRHGLKGMRERAELIGAEFQITSQPDHGTTIQIEVPINIQETPV